MAFARIPAQPRAGNAAIRSTAAHHRSHVSASKWRFEGVQGRGMAVYFINPHVAWNGSLEIRKEEARETVQPRLELVRPGE